ncbi:MAG TPA: HAD family phosphatase [Patescibacteria group bacterium]|nr:HAD family phosphatase [Patescibacteria group bacterium]
MKLTAVIFDLDGTIINSEEAWGKCFINVFKSIGSEFDNNHPQTRGLATKVNLKNIISKYHIKTDKSLDELQTLINIEYVKQIPYITLNEGVLEFMDYLTENNFPFALATSTNWEIVSKILEQFNLQDSFDSITTGEEVINPKPAPDIFLLASEKLGIDPADCLVIEDSPAGVKAAIEAGMKVIAISSFETDENELDEANLEVSSFADITPKVIDQL